MPGLGCPTFRSSLCTTGLFSLPPSNRLLRFIFIEKLICRPNVFSKLDTTPLSTTQERKVITHKIAYKLKATWHNRDSREHTDLTDLLLFNFCLVVKGTFTSVVPMLATSIGGGSGGSETTIIITR